MNELEELVNRVRQLTPGELEQFSAWFASHETGGLNARDAAWDALAAGRDADIESGKARVVAGADFITRLRSQLK